MKSKIIKVIYIAAILIVAWSSAATAQDDLRALNPKLDALVKPLSNRNWLEFRDETKINPATVFTDLKDAFELSKDDEMRVKKAKKDELGFTTYRYDQFYKGYRVLYGEYLVHQQPDGFVRSANGRLINGLKLEASPAVSENQALQAGLIFMKAKKFLWQNPEMEKELKRQQKNEAATYYPKGELVIAPFTNSNKATFASTDYKLTWHFKIYTDDVNVAAKSIYVDAASGKVIHYTDISMNCAGATGGSAFNGSVSFSSELNAGSYRSHNDCQATNIYVYNCNGAGAANTFYTDADNAWTDVSQQSAVQAQWGALMTYNYYIGQHSRASWNNAAGNMIAYNNAFAGSNNACWGCTGNSAIFYAGSTSASTDDWNTNDLMGHEFTHGVTQSEANLTYSYESGALNESFSDIFGEMIESWSEGNCDYLVGADRGAIRSLSNPPAYSDYAGAMPDTYLGTGWYAGATDNGGVHHNSSVQNHWFYLLSEGGTGTTDFGVSYNVAGITRFKARLIAYRALTEYLTSSSQYIDARKATLQAAYDLYGQCSPEIVAVGDAWHAVGVESQSVQFTKNACGSYPASGDFVQAISQLSAANGCTTQITPGTIQVYFTARDRVVLNPGFTATVGSKLIAYIEPCSSTMYKTGSTGPAIIMSDPEKGIRNQPPVTMEKVALPSTLSIPNEIAVSPNPFTSDFNININWKQEEKAVLIMYNSSGVKVLEKQGIGLSKGSNQVTVNGSNLAKGVYMVELNIGGVKHLNKVLKM